MSFEELIRSLIRLRFVIGGKPSFRHPKERQFLVECTLYFQYTYVYLHLVSCHWIVVNVGKYYTWIGMEFKTRRRETETCVCLKRTQRKKLKRSTRTTYLSLVGGSDTTTHHIFRICPAPLAIDGCGISLLLLPFASRKTTLEKSMRKKYKKII